MRSVTQFPWRTSPSKKKTENFCEVITLFNTSLDDPLHPLTYFHAMTILCLVFEVLIFDISKNKNFES